MVFDRGGYSPQVFTEIIGAGFDLLTYYKGAWARAAVNTFPTVDYRAPDGSSHSYELAERSIALPVPGRHATTTGTVATAASTLTLRLIIRRSPDGHQTPILTNRTDLTAAQIAYRMANRWRQENYFTYAREHFALDAVDSYADTPDDLARLVPNPAKAHAISQVAGARADLTAAHADMADAFDTAAAAAGKPGNGGKATVDPAAGLACAPRSTTSKPRRRRLAPPKRTCRSGRSAPTAGCSKPNALRTHAIRMSAYNSESALARLLRPHYSRGDDEARALLRDAFTLPGDLQIIGDTPHVRLDPASAPRRSKALAALCTELTDTKTPTQAPN